MKRPLAVCGFGFLLSSLAACLLPAGLLLPLAAPLAVLFLVWLLWRRKTQKPRRSAGYLPLLLATAAAALCFRAGYDAAIVRPVVDLAGTEALATARVDDTAPGYGGDTVHATLKVQALDGQSVRPFTVEVKGVAEVGVGQVVEVPLGFYAFSDTRTASYNGAKGRYVGARAQEAPVPVGEDLTALCRLRLWRYAAGDSIREKGLPQRLSSVLAAMAVGDRRFVSADTAEAYRMAGLSHLLVVSGLHLSILAGLVYAVFRALTRSRRTGSALAFAAVLFFMAFTGFTPSIVRSGVAALLVLLARIISKKPDILTSMGLAALLLCLQNPCAAADVGLLLSFTATLGAIGGGTLAQWLQTRRERKRFRAGKGYATALHRRLARMGWGVAAAALVSASVTIATLPVTIWISGGISLLTVPMNIIAVPLLAPIVVCGLLMVLPAAGPLLLITQSATLIAGGLLVFLEKLMALAAARPALYLPVGGLFGLLCVSVVYALVFLAFKTRWRRSYLAGAACMAVLAVGLHLALSAGTVRLTVAGSGAASSLVVTKDGQSVVLYRGRLSANGVERALHSQRAEDCVLFVDLRRDPQSTEYEGRFAPEQVVTAAEDIIGQQVYTPLEGVTVYVKNQGGGTVACVEVEGYKTALVTGSADLTAYAAVDVLIVGGGEVTGSYDTLLATGALPDWANSDARLLYADGTPQILIRPGTGVIFRETLPGE